MAAAQLSHPNIVAAHDADEFRGLHFLVMEYAEGRDLAGLVRSRGPMAVATAVDYVLQAAQGLANARSSGSSTATSSLQLAADHGGTVKVLDIGLARIGPFPSPRRESSGTRP